MFLTSVLITFVLSLTSYVSAMTKIVPRDVHRLLTRQTTVDPSEIPPVCSEQCTLIVSAINGCAEVPSFACGCSLAVESGAVDCFNCLLFGAGVVPTPEEIQSSQDAIDGVVSRCNADGVNLPSTTLSHLPTQPSATGNFPSEETVTVNAPPQPTVSVDAPPVTVNAPPQETVTGNRGQTSTSPTQVFVSTPLLSSPSTITASPVTTANSENKNSVSAVGAVAVAAALLGLLC